MSANGAVFSVDSNARKIADSLCGACELVEECSFSGVLVACERESEGSSVRKGSRFSLDVIFSFLAESGMSYAAGFVKGTDEFFGLFGVLSGLDGDSCCVVGSECEFVVVDADL